MINTSIHKGQVTDISGLRQLYLQQCNCQVRYNACHERGWTDTYLLLYEQKLVGYASIKGLDDLNKRNTLFETYVLPAYQHYTHQWMSKLIRQVGLKYMEAQTNDLWTSSILRTFCKEIESDVILFQDAHVTQWEVPGAKFRKWKAKDDVFGKKQADVGSYVLELNGEIVADGGFLLHYNKPFADLYMETALKYRNQGYATYILQEIKKECYLANRIPAARCNISNRASRAALLKAGMEEVGYMLKAKIK